jgi:F-type H+-transporting ATPase subunit alpha
VLKQGQYQPMPVEKQVMQIYSATSKDPKSNQIWVRPVPVPQILRYMKELIDFMDARHPDVGKAIAEKKQLDDGLRAQLDQALTEFKEVFVIEEAAPQAAAPAPDKAQAAAPAKA